MTKRNPTKLDRCVEEVKASDSAIDPYAICNASLKRSRQKNPAIMQAPELPAKERDLPQRKMQAPYLPRQKNPLINGNQRDVKKAMKLYSEFRESKPKRGGVLEIDWPTVLMSIGNVRFIGYDTTIAGKTQLFKHEFAPGSRPILCADDQGQLFIVGGRYRFKTGTLNGIVDRDSRGKDIDDGA